MKEDQVNIDTREKIQKTYGSKIWKETNDPELRKIGKRKERPRRSRYDNIVYSDEYQDNL